MLIFAVLFSILGIFGAFLSMDNDGSIAIAAVSLIFAGIFVLAYFLTKHTVFYISYAGGMIAFDLRFSAANAGPEFQKQLILLKDKARKEYKK